MSFEIEPGTKVKVKAIRNGMTTVYLTAGPHCEGTVIGYESATGSRVQVKMPWFVRRQIVAVKDLEVIEVPKP